MVTIPGAYPYLSMLHRINYDIQKKLDFYLEDHTPIITRMIAEGVLEAIQMQISDKGYQILGEYLMFRLAEAVQNTTGLRKAITEAKGNTGRDLVYKLMNDWLAEAWHMYRQMLSGGSQLKDKFKELGFVRTPDPAPLTPEQEKIIDDLLGI